MAYASFVHLRVRSGFSLLEGAVKFDDLAKSCVGLRMPAVALTDSANLFGAMQFSSSMTKAGVQPILGTTIALAFLDERPRTTTKEPPAEPIVLLVKDEQGYRNLSKLLSQAYLESDPTQGLRFSIERLESLSEGLICLTGGSAGPIGQALLRGEGAYADRLTVALKAIFGDRLYIELQRHGLPQEDEVEGELLELAYRHEIPLVATNDVHFIAAQMHEAHDVLLALGQGTTLHDQNRRRVTVDHRFKSAEEMAALFADLPEAIANTLVVARRCAYAAPERKPILPTFAADEDAEMRRQATEGLEKRLRQAVFVKDMDGASREKAARPYHQRLAYELDVISQMKFPGYFLIVSDFIKWAKSQGIPVGPGRGSGAGSVVAWSLEITDLDPLRFGLLFERFLNPERVSMPDFDIDFCEERRGEVIAYVRDRYGADRVAQIITFGTLQARAALRDVGRVMGLPFGMVDRICKLVPQNPANPINLTQALEMEPRLKEAMREDENIARMMDIARQLEGLPRNASTHAAGVVIGDRPLDELVPLYQDPRAQLPATQFNMKDVEKAGLVKFDFLGLSTLTLLRFAEEIVHARGIDLDLSALELDDPESYRLLAKAETTGVFQLESGGMRDALRKLKPDCFEDIIAMVSLYRPGPMDNIPRYTAVKHKLEEPAYLHPLLEPILSETNGVIIYQEQVMEIAKQLAGYSLGGADLLRRAMGKKIKAEMDAQREVFVKGAAGNGIADDLANTIFDAVAKFASYGFNKSHAAAYALLAYHTAYLKANHGVEFYAAAMTTEMASQEKLAAFRQEMQSRGLELLPPDVDFSQPKFAVEDRSDGKPAVRFALAAIKGVGLHAMEELVRERVDGESFGNIFDLVRRVGTKTLNRRILEALIKAGALDGLDANRKRSMLAIDSAFRWAAACQEAAVSGQWNMFGSGEQALPPKPTLPETEDWPAMERLQYEMEAIGFYMSAHPLDSYRSALERLRITPAAELRHALGFAERTRIKLAGVVLGKQERVTERSRFAFAQLSDPSGQFEVMLFNEALAQSRELLESRDPLLVEVDARLDGENVKLSVLRMEKLDGLVDRRGPTSIEIRLVDTESALRLKPLLNTSGAGARIRLVIVEEGEEITLNLPETYALPYQRRADVERHPGVREIRDITLH
ncbi:DNA polymerase III, alpha subunit [Arboricoccus pini]|uniref:DNA polymerase III subunit alpha n=1 Tax=Arboricoccus pini TaxID=1963835 RepID=A0A212R7F4_9PROT|nr:DNA polymerase III subunit alpha [Arboricoccus pini]SNB68035.1 DNA polymerase III, alpha subunit [Arboricoccus pini]